MSEFPFEFGDGEVYQFTKDIAIPVYGSPTVEELLFVQDLQGSADHLTGLLDFAVFFVNSRCGTEFTKENFKKFPVKKLNKLMEFFNKETQSMSAGDDDNSKNVQTGALSTGDSNSITPTNLDSVESNSGVAL